MIENTSKVPKRKPLKNLPKRTRRRAVALLEAIAVNNDEGELKRFYRPVIQYKRKPGDPLLRYPKGESPIERGLPARWC